MYRDNWTVLTHDSDCIWKYGAPEVISGDRLEQITDFLRALNRLGLEIFGEGVGLLRLRYSRPHPTRARDILVVNLADRYSLILSDPMFTSRLLTNETIGKIRLSQVADNIHSILAGTASMIYASFYTEEDILPNNVVDSLFSEAVRSVTLCPDVVVGDGQCSFSAMSLQELLFFHYLLKELFEQYVAKASPGREWGVVQGESGAPIYLSENSPMPETAALTAFVSVINTYCKVLFEATPQRLIFGGSALTAMDFIVGSNSIMILNNAPKLFSLERFVRQWAKIPLEVQKDLSPPLAEFCRNKAAAQAKDRLDGLELHRLINRMTGMGIRRARSYRID